MRGEGGSPTYYFTTIFPPKLHENEIKIGQRQWRIQDFPNGGRCFVANGGAHILFSGKKCMKLKEIGLKWGGARLLAPCYSKITIFL